MPQFRNPEIEAAFLHLRELINEYDRPDVSSHGDTALLIFFEEYLARLPAEKPRTPEQIAAARAEADRRVKATLDGFRDEYAALSESERATTTLRDFVIGRCKDVPGYHGNFYGSWHYQIGEFIKAHEPKPAPQPDEAVDRRFMFYGRHNAESIKQFALANQPASKPREPVATLIRQGLTPWQVQRIYPEMTHSQIDAQFTKAGIETADFPARVPLRDIADGQIEEIEV
jgi:hypothetical protein